MKSSLLLIALAVFSSQAFARRCVPDLQGQSIFSTRCEVSVKSTSTSECHILRSGNSLPGTYYPSYHSHPWERTIVGETASACDIDLQACQDLAFRKLENFSYTNNCGDYSVGKSVEYRFQTLNADQSVRAEVSGRMKK